MKKQTILLAVFASVMAVSCKKDKKDDKKTDQVESYSIGSTKYSVDHENKIVSIKDNGDGTGTKTLSNDTTYVLDGMVFVNSGNTLTIEAGTVIKGKSGEAEKASALIVARGAKIMAEGTAAEPIIFTAEADDLNGSVAVTDQGLWGGVIILGSAKLNTTPSVLNVEGIPTNESRGEYGGTDDSDNSGVLKYISIRHGGTNIGADNEINGLTLGGVGNGTTIDYIEVIGNQDDGIEFFGGSVNVKHAVIAYCGDDSFDWDQGYRGKGQFWFAAQVVSGDRCGELDGADDPEDGRPFGGGTVYNATFIGQGADAGKKLGTFRANGGGSYINCLFANQAKGFDIQLKNDAQDSYKMFQDGMLDVKYNVFDGVAGDDATKFVKIGPEKDDNDVVVVDAATVEAAEAALDTYLATANNVSASTGINVTMAGLNPVPTSGVDNVTSNPGGFFDAAAYNGAFEPSGSNWAAGWTLLFQ